MGLEQEPELRNEPSHRRFLRVDERLNFLLRAASPPGTTLFWQPALAVVMERSKEPPSEVAPLPTSADVLVLKATSLMF